MNNRFAAFLLIFIALNSIYAQEVNQNKPNILWVVIEDTSPQFIGCYGNKNASTPNIDKLASNGIRFSSAFSTGSVCSPSRTCIITGVKTYKTGTGNHRSAYPIPDYIKGFPYFLQKEGYYTTNNNKTDYNVANPDDFIKEAWNESSSKAGWWNRKPGQPFFAVFNFIDSHQSRTMTESYSYYSKNVIDELPEKDRIGENDFEMPPFYKDSPEMRKQMARVYNSIKLTDNKIGDLLAKLDNDKLRDSTIIFFYADHGEGIPRGKTNGINLGYRVPFVLWIPEMYKELSPWGKSGVVTDELIDFEDLAPTLISLAGGKVPNYLTGRIMLGKNRSKPANHLVLSNDRSDNGIDLVRTVTNGKFVYSRNFMPFMPELRNIHYAEVSDIKKQMRKDLSENKLNTLQKQLFEDRPAEFLFDIENDIWETNNLANNPKYKTVLQSMRAQLKDEVIQSRDIMFLPEFEMALLSTKTTPYEFRLDNKKYSIKNIYKAASLSGFRNKKTTAKQIKLLKNSNEAIRYWAMIGLRSQNATNLKPYEEIIDKAMNDTYLPVSVTASAIAYQEFNSNVAKENLIKYSLSENKEIALMAVNYLLYVTNKQPFIAIMQSQIKRKDISYEEKSASYDFLQNLGILDNTLENSK
jgi:arylsulfatase A-like enzyme